MTWKTTFAAIVLLASVTACGTTPVEPAPTIQSECLWAEIIRPTQGDVDVISDQLVEQVLRHNRLVEEHCDDSDSESAVSGHLLTDPSAGTYSA